MFTSKYYFYNIEMSRKNLRFVFMKNLLFFDYQLPIFACLVLFFAMVTYWISLYFPKKGPSTSITLTYDYLRKGLSYVYMVK